MKKFKKCLVLAVITVLALNVVTGCGKGDNNEATEMVAIAVTEETTVETTEAVTEATTQPTEETIAPTVDMVEEPVEEPTEEPTEPEGTRGVVCNTQNLNVRSAPGVANERVAKLTRGTEVTVYETVKKYGAVWGRIDEGWICMDYIKLDGESSPVSPAEEPTEETERPTEPKEESTTPTEPQHEHSYKKAVTSPTCTEKGFTTYTCSCGDSYKDDYVDTLGHLWSGWKTIKEPTEIAEGKAERTCANCSKKETKSLPKLIPNHTHKYSEKVSKEPTCTSAGTKIFTCSCGDSYTESIPKTGHQYSDKVTAPTCTEKGYTTHTCGKCGESYRDAYQNAIGHSFAQSDFKAATCTENGYTKYSCKNCSEVKTEAIQATGHNWGNWMTIEEPTADSEGSEERICSTCSKKENRTLPRLPASHTHQYTEEVTKEATCTADGTKNFTCSCGDSYTTSVTQTGHSWSGWVTVQEPTESIEGKAERTCSKCSAVEYKALDKLPTVPAEPEKPTECAHGELPGYFHKEQKVAPTCTEDGYWTTKCILCGEIGPNQPSYEFRTGHNYEITDSKEVTCAQDGYTCYCCSACGDAYTETNEGGHNWKWNYWIDPNGYTREYWTCSDKDWRWYPEDGTDLMYAFKDHVERDHDGVFYKYSYANDIEYVGEPSRFWWTCTRCGRIVESEYGGERPPQFG